MIGQNTSKGPETCKHRQMWATEGKRIEGLLLSDGKSAVGRSYKLRGFSLDKNTRYVLFENMAIMGFDCIGSL